MLRLLFLLVAAFVFQTVSVLVEAAVPDNGIYINLASRSLSLYTGGNKRGEYPIAIGNIATPSPCGSFQVISMEMNPVWIDPKDNKNTIEAGWGNPLGLRWIGFFENYGIHGNNNPDSIGEAVSNGCIRMFEDDVEEVYEVVDIGWPVVLVYERMVFEKQSNGTYGLRIYPDGYDRQNLTVADVQAELSRRGLNSALTKEEISNKLLQSNGEMTILRKVYKVEIDGRWISGKAIEFDGVLYLPLMSVSRALRIPYNWVRETGELTTEKGKDLAISVNDELLITPQCAEKLFGVAGAFDEKEVYCLFTEGRRREMAAEAEAKAAAAAKEAEQAKAMAYGNSAPAEDNVEKVAPTKSGAVVQQGKG